MKIALFGETLYAEVMASVLLDYGHEVRWHKDDHSASESDVYIFCYSPTELIRAKAVLAAIAQHPLTNAKLMINGSTFGLHGTEQLKAILPDHHWVYFPDIIQEGNEVNSLLNAQQVMVGIQSEVAKMQMQEFLRPLFPQRHQLLFMPILDAEFAKLSISGMLAARISYMNDLALVAEKLGVDITNVKQGMGADPRIGASYLSPGVGFGGENFSHDILTLSSEVSKSGVKSRLLEQVWQINEDQKEILFRKLWNYYHSDLKGKTIAIWGAAFKENTTSIHNSPIHHMLKALWAQGAKVQLHDPQALPEIKAMYGERADLLYCEDRYDAVAKADALCVITAWKLYHSPDYVRLLSLMKHPLILDGRNIYDPVYMVAQGFVYQGVGR